MCFIDNFGERCHTATEGKTYAERFNSCTQEQMHQYDSLNQEYDSLGVEYDKLPQMARSESEYQYGMAMYQKLQNLYSQIENFRC